MRRFDEKWERRRARSLIQVEHLNNVPSINMSHAFNLTQIYLFLCDSVDAQRESDPSDPVIAAVQDPFLDWHKDEALKVGVISSYHLWERRVRDFVGDQFALLQLSVPPQGRRSFVSWARDRLSGDLGAEIDDELWDLIEESRQIANAVKHGDDSSFGRLRERFPQYFPAERAVTRLDPADSFCVPRSEFERLAQSFRDFWEFLPYKLTL